MVRRLVTELIEQTIEAIRTGFHRGALRLAYIAVSLRSVPDVLFSLGELVLDVYRFARGRLPRELKRRSSFVMRGGRVVRAA